MLRELPVRARLHDLRDRPRDDPPTCSRCSALRAKQPERPRPYRAWGTPWISGLYIAANLAIAVGLAVGSPLSVGVSAAVIVAALPVYAALKLIRREVA